MKSFSANSTGFARTRCGWMAAMPHPILTVIPRRNDALRNRFICLMADAAARRLAWNQPRDGMAFCRGAGHAGAQGERSGAIAHPYRAGPRIGDWQRGVSGGVARHGTAAGDDPLFRRRRSVWPWNPFFA